MSQSGRGGRGRDRNGGGGFSGTNPGTPSGEGGGGPTHSYGGRPGDGRGTFNSGAHPRDRGGFEARGVTKPGAPGSGGARSVYDVLSGYSARPSSFPNSFAEARKAGAANLDFLGAAYGYDKLTDEEKQDVAAHIDPVAAGVHRLGSFLLPGIDSTLTVNNKGQLAEVQKVDPIGLGLGFAARAHPLLNIGSGLYQRAIDDTFHDPLASPLSEHTTTRTLEEAAALTDKQQAQHKANKGIGSTTVARSRPEQDSGPSAPVGSFGIGSFGLGVNRAPSTNRGPKDYGTLSLLERLYGRGG